MMSPDDRQRYERALAWLGDPARRARLAADLRVVAEATTPMTLPVAHAARANAAASVTLFAGSFNPPTRAHLAVADAARALGGALCWMISRVTVDKEDVARAPLPDRLLTLGALSEPRPGELVAVVNRGLYRDQAAAARVAFPAARSVRVLVGFDKIRQIFDPRYYTDRDAALADLFALTDVIVAPRGEERAGDLAALLDQPANRRWRERVAWLPLPDEFTTMSSTVARDRIAAGDYDADSLPPEVAALIATGAYAP